MCFIRNKRQKRTLSFSDVECLVVEAECMHFELVPAYQIIKFRNVISPRDSGMFFSDGYFDEKTITISDNSIQLISTVFNRMFQKRAPEYELSDLPPGATRDAYMRIILKENKTAYYSNTHPIENGFRVEHEVIASEFTQIVQILEQNCAVPGSAKK